MEIRNWGPRWKGGSGRKSEMLSTLLRKCRSQLKLVGKWFINAIITISLPDLISFHSYDDKIPVKHVFI